MRLFKKLISSVVAMCFACSLIIVAKASAGEINVPFMPKPGTMVNF